MARRNQPSEKTTLKRVEKYKLVYPLLKAMYREFQELSKKKPDGQVGATKVKIVNRLLEPIHEILSEEGNISFLDKLDQDDLPQNSDVTLILSQTEAAMDAYRAKYVYWNGSAHVWSCEEAPLDC